MKAQLPSRLGLCHFNFSYNCLSTGSIRFLKGAELSVLHLGTNQRICLKYIFLEKIPRMKKNISELVRKVVRKDSIVA